MLDFQKLDSKNIWHPFTPLTGADDPVFIESAEGVFLKTIDGRKIIDAISSWWVNIHGHSNPFIADAISQQARKLEHVIFAGFTHEPAIRLSEKLLKILPKNQSRIFFSDNGSTAVEVGLKMAIQYWYNQRIEKKKIIAIEGAYHGDTFGSMSVGDRGLFTKPFSPFLFDVDFIEFPTEENADRVLASFQALLDSGSVAAFIYEPLVQAAAGMRMYSRPLLDELILRASKNDVICIADEVFTGFCRTGKMFASDHLQNQPDIIALSKGLTGGTLPLGVTACSEKIVQAFQSDSLAKTFFHGHSFTANPLSCAAANCSIDMLLNTDCQSRIRNIAWKQEEFIQSLQSLERVSDARNLGTIAAVELKTESKTSYTNEIRRKIYKHFLDRDILLRPLGNVLYILPPYIITDEQLDRIYNEVITFLK
jgi:adenosylmethionine---8-amino-7-oxononanoate aminotransferase